MQTSDFHDVLRKVKPFTNEICLHLMGEPTAHPQLEEILKIANIESFKINLTTNGLLIKRNYRLLSESKSIRQINFSLQSFTDNFPNKPLIDYLLPIMEFTKHVLNLRDDLYINYRLWNFGSDQNQNIDIFQEIEKYFDISFNKKVQVENIKSKKIWKKLYLHFDSRFEWPNLEREVINDSGRCHGLSSHIGIHADGTVVPCCLDSEAVINLGNIKDNSLSEILNSQLALDMKKGFEENKLIHDLCRRCGYIKRFQKKN